MRWGNWLLVVGFAFVTGVADSAEGQKLTRSQWEAEAKAMVTGQHRSCGGFLVSKYARPCKTCSYSTRHEQGDPPVYTFLKEPVQFRVGSHPLSEADKLNGLRWRGWVKYRVKTYGLSMDAALPIGWTAGFDLDGKGQEFIDEFQATDEGLRIVAYQDGPEPDGGQFLASFRVHEQCADYCLDGSKVELVEPAAWKCGEVYKLEGFPKKPPSQVKPQ